MNAQTTSISAWPNSSHIAVVFNVAYEAWSDGKGPAIGPMGNPLPSGAVDSNAVSWGNYGEIVGINRLLAILKRSGVQANVMVSGILAERQPDIVRRIHADGHDIMAHSFAQDVVPVSLGRDEDRANIERTTSAIQRVTGVRPLGWGSPRGTPGDLTVSHLAEFGYQWYADALDNDVPYWKRVGDRALVSIPFTMDINDLPHAMRFGRTPQQFVDMFDAYLTHAARANDGPIIIDVTAHAHCYGRPGNSWAYEEALNIALGRKDIWITTRGKIAEYFKATQK